MDDQQFIIDMFSPIEPQLNEHGLTLGNNQDVVNECQQLLIQMTKNFNQMIKQSSSSIIVEDLINEVYQTNH